MNRRIKLLRNTLDLTQQKFADRLGVKGNTISQYESGRNAPVDSVISLICREFNVSETWLRTGAGEMFAPEPVFDLGEYVKRRGMTELETQILRAYLELDPELRESLLQHFKERLSAQDAPSEPAPVDIAAKLAKLERQNQELAAKVAAMEEEDARMEAEDELSTSGPSGGGTKLA